MFEDAGGRGGNEDGPTEGAGAGFAGKLPAGLGIGGKVIGLGAGDGAEGVLPIDPEGLTASLACPKTVLLVEADQSTTFCGLGAAVGGGGGVISTRWRP